MTDLEYIVSKLSKEEILCQIAEEASELAQAALKLRRAITGLNPTPLSVDAATDDFFEELADVTVAKDAYFELVSDHNGCAREFQGYVDAIADMKRKRWAERLRAKEDEDDQSNN